MMFSYSFCMLLSHVSSKNPVFSTTGSVVLPMDVLQVSEILKDAEEARRQEIRSQEARGSVAEIRGSWTGIDYPLVI